jgi:hypothetical protein
MRRFALGWKKLGHEKRLKAYIIINYADDRSRVISSCTSSFSTVDPPERRSLLTACRVSKKAAGLHSLSLSRKEQNKARRDEVFGGFSSAERLEYEAREKRISDLQAELKTSSQSGMTAAEQRRKWNKHPEIDSSQSHARQPYLSREKG